MRFLTLLIALLLGTTAAAGQATEIRDDMLDHFRGSSAKVLRMAEAMPSELYDWAPMEGAMTVAMVYAHIARYNFMYLEENLGIPAPEGIDWENAETLTDKAAIAVILAASVQHASSSIEALTEADLVDTTTLYGREVPGWAVLTQLVAHLNEHVGQAVSYGRMNDIVPPWSR